MNGIILTKVDEIEENVKTLATRILERMGIDQKTAIDMFYRQIILK